MLGWDTKDLGGFSDIVEPLGAVLNLVETSAGKAWLGNRVDRIRDVKQEADLILSSGRLAQRAIARLRGRLLFARVLCYGRSGGNALRVLANAALKPGCAVASIPGFVDALKQLVEHLEFAPS